MPKPEPLPVPGVPTNNDTYSQVVRLGDLVFVSGQLGLDPSTGQPLEGIQAQTRKALDNVAAALAAAGSGLDRVAKVNIFITDFSLLGEMNLVYRTYFPHRPAKTTVEISRLDRGALIEIEAVAGL
ncbi:MAG: RidA family protein [Acidobacteria bacterium]|nr:RidA family protein [Acidobacteriota bacterium]